jgi:hypothetical protein
LGLSSYGANNFPFLVQSNFQNPNPTTPITPDNSIGTLENRLLNVPLTASSATVLNGITLLGAQFHWQDAGTQNYNFFLEYQIGAHTTAKAGYSGSQTRHLQVTLPSNTVATLLPPGLKLQKNIFFPDLGPGGSIQLANGNANYNGLLLNIEHRAGNPPARLISRPWVAPRPRSRPPFHRLDLSFFKEIRTTERTHIEFRAEFFNLTNTPNFALPSRRNFIDTQHFGTITSTRDAPNDPREIQFALKFYF